MKPTWNRGLGPHDDLATVELRGVCAGIAVVIILAVIMGALM